MTAVPDGIEGRYANPALAVIAGLTYIERSQVFQRWVMPTYRTAFRWTGNRADAEDATTWTFLTRLIPVRLPELVSVVDDRAVEATIEAVCRHWSDRYGVSQLRCSETRTGDAAHSGYPAIGLDALFERLSAEARLLLVLRFVRRRPLPAISTQLGFQPGLGKIQMYAALTSVAERIGFAASAGEGTQVDQVASFVDAVIAKRTPLRVDVSQAVWAGMVAAAHVQGAIAGNDLPSIRFIRILEDRFVKSGVRTGM